MLGGQGDLFNGYMDPALIEMHSRAASADIPEWSTLEIQLTNEGRMAQVWIRVEGTDGKKRIRACTVRSGDIGVALLGSLDEVRDMYREGELKGV